MVYNALMDHIVVVIYLVCCLKLHTLVPVLLSNDCHGKGQVKVNVDLYSASS